MTTKDDEALERAARVKALIGEGEQAAARGDLFRARDTFKSALEVDPREPSALLALGSLYERMGNNPPGIMARQDLWMDAIKTYEALMEVEPAHVEARVRAGYTHLRFGEFEGKGDKAIYHFKKAAEQLDKALELDPKHAGAWYARAYAHLHTNQQPEAVAAFSKAAALSPKNVDAWWNLGILQELQGNYQEALEAFQNVAALDPKREETDGKLQKMRIRLEPGQGTKVNQKDEDAALARLDTGMKLVAESNFPKAIQFLSQALQQFETTGNITGQLEAVRNVAAAYKGLRKWDASRDALCKTRALAIKKGDVQKQAEAAHNLGYVSFLAGDVSTAIEMFTESTSLFRKLGDNAKLADGLANLGRAHRNAGDGTRALQVFDDGLKIDMETGNASNQAKDQCEIAETYMFLDDPTRAIEHYKEAISIYQRLEYGWKVTEIQDIIKGIRKAVNNASENK